jgi:hypothetical protein
VIDDWVTLEEKRLVAVADAMPADKYPFAPTNAIALTENYRPVLSVIGSRVENRRSGFSLPVAVGVLSHDPPQSGLA